MKFLLNKNFSLRKIFFRLPTPNIVVVYERLLRRRRNLTTIRVTCLLTVFGHWLLLALNPLFSELSSSSKVHCLKKVFYHLPLYEVKLPLILVVWAGQGRTLKFEKWGHLFLCPWHSVQRQVVKDFLEAVYVVEWPS